MTRSNLKKLIRLYVPGAKTNRVTDTTLNLLIQKAIDDICVELRPMRTNSKFNVEANIYQYDLSTEVDRFLSIEPSGLWWNAGSAASTDWQKVYPRTLEWLDRNRPNWRDLSTGDPQWYAQEADELIIVPTPDTDLTDGFWLWFNQKPTRMGSDSHYPFGYDAQIERLAILDDLIVKFCEWKLKNSVGKKQEALATYQEYKDMKRDKSKVLDRRLDVSASHRTKLQGRQI